MLSSSQQEEPACLIDVGDSMLNHKTVHIKPSYHWHRVAQRRCLYIETGPRVQVSTQRYLHKAGALGNAAHTCNIGSVLDQLWSPTPKYMPWWGSYWSLRLIQPKRRTTTHELRIFSYTGARLWNNCEIIQRLSDIDDISFNSLEEFKILLKGWDGPAPDDLQYFV